MATREIVTLECDLCGGDDMVQTHTLVVDGSAVECEACLTCWQAIMNYLVPFSKAGRKPTPTKIRKKDVVPFPGLAWAFSSHALIRLGERHLDPTHAVKAAEDPELSHPGLQPFTEVRIRDEVKVVIDPRKRLVLTVSKRGEEVESVA